MTGWIFIQILFIVLLVLLLLWHSLVVALAKRASHSAKISEPRFWPLVMGANLVLMVLSILIVLFVRPS